MSTTLVAGVDLGGTNMQVGIVDEAGGIIARQHARTNASAGADSVLNTLASIITAAHKEACDSISQSDATLAAVGIAAPGACDVKRGIVLQTGNLGWTDFPLAQKMLERLDITKTVVVDNDVNAAVFGECALGAGRDSDHALGVWVGTGIGAGIVVDNQLFYGPMWTAGEFGQQTVRPGAFTGEAILEHACSRSAVIHRLSKLVNTQADSIVPDLLREMRSTDDLRELDAWVVAAAYQRGDALTHTVVHEAADLLGIAIANACTLLSFKTILLGGGLSEALGEPYRDRVLASAQRHVFPSAHADDLDIRLTTLRENAGILGAAMLARNRSTGA